jgi:hypothetical protein
VAGLPASGLTRGCCLYGHGVKPAVEFALEQIIDRAMAIEPGHARKGFSDDANAEMGFAGSVKRVMMIAACVIDGRRAGGFR